MPHSENWFPVVTVSYVLSSLLLPPTSLVASTLVGVALIRRRPRLGWFLIVGSQCGLLALSLPIVASALARTLEPPPVNARDLQRAQAIVIFGGGRDLGSPEWGGESVNQRTLQRVRYGAHLARTTGLPVFVTGGRPDGGVATEGALMRDTLVREFQVPVRWVDSLADTTYENAQMAAKELRPAGIARVVLVTEAIHIPRSQRALESAGLEVIAAPTSYSGQNPFTWYQLVPGVGALRLTYYVLREWVSQGYYILRGG